MKIHWFRRQRREEELDAEIRSHLNEAIRVRLARRDVSDEARECSEVDWIRFESGTMTARKDKTP